MKNSPGMMHQEADVLHESTEVSFFDHFAEVGFRVIMDELRIFVDAFLDLTL